MKKLRVVISTPSMIDQSRLASIFVNHARFEVVSLANDLSATYSKVEELIPDVVLISNSFARTDEYECMLSLFSAVEAVPVIIMSAVLPDHPKNEIGQSIFFIHTRLASFEIINVIESALKAKPIQQTKHFSSLSAQNTLQFSKEKVVVIGASTGGIDALTTLLAHFPKNCPPTAIVQHTGQNFRETLVRLLARRCSANVVMAEHGLEMVAGRVCLAGGSQGHFRLNPSGSIACTIEQGPLISGHMPSIDELFLSAVPLGTRVMAVLLTGMGRDGATGLLSLRRAGAATIGQNQETSVVYGMPRVAYEIGAVQKQLPLEQIGPAIMDWAATAPQHASIRRAAE